MTPQTMSKMMREVISEKRIAVLLSGGVDSAVVVSELSFAFRLTNDIAINSRNQKPCHRHTENSYEQVPRKHR